MTYKLKDEDKELQCIKEIKRRLGNMGTMLADSNEAMMTTTISMGSLQQPRNGILFHLPRMVFHVRVKTHSISGLSSLL